MTASVDGTLLITDVTDTSIASTPLAGITIVTRSFVESNTFDDFSAT